MELTLIAKFFGGLALDLAKSELSSGLGEAIDRKLSDSAIKDALNQAVGEADGKVPRLFATYERDGLKGTDRFLSEAFRGTAISELKKPLQKQGKPDAALLTKVFLREAKAHPRLKAIEAGLVEDWMQAFTEAYFQTTNNFLSFQVTKEQYYQQLRAKTGKVVFSGMAVDGTVVDEPGELARIFVMPDVRRQDAKRYESSADLVSTVPLEIAQDEQKRILWEQQQQLALMKEENSGQKAVSAVELLKKKDEQRIVILGAPGAGKTTLMNYWVVTAAAAQLKKIQTQEGASSSDSASKSVSDSLPGSVFATADCFPVLIRIRDLAREPDLSVLDFLTKFVKADLEVASVSTDFFRHWLETGEALILLDGLDEVADDAQRHKVVGKIETFLGAYPRCPAIITSRPAGYRDDYFSRRQYPHYELLPFDDDKIETFINHWYDSRVDLTSERERRKDSLRSALENKPRIKQLARNPLLLTIITLIHRYRTLPRQRHELYNSAVDTLISKWDEDKELTTRHVLKYLDIPDIRRLMERLAYWIHTQGSVDDVENGTQIERSTLIGKLTKFIKEIKASEKLETYAARAEAETLLDKIVKDRAGLLAKQGDRRYAFVHKTFQEYLCSKEILYLQEDQDPDDDNYVPHAKQHIKKYLHDPHWREVLLLLVAQQTPNQAKASLKTILKASSEHEQWLHRDVLFAGSCLAENTEINDPATINEILTKLVNLEILLQLQPSSKLRGEVFHAISGLKDTPFAPSVMACLTKHQQKIKQERFDRYRSRLESDSVVQQILPLLQDSHPSVRYRATKSLGELGNSSDTVIDALVRLLQDDYSNVRYHAAESLGELGNSSDTVIYTLIGLLRDDNWNVRSRVAKSLVQLGPNSNAVIDALSELLQDDDHNVRSHAAESLIRLGTSSDTVINALLKLIQSGCSDVRYRVAESLGEIDTSSDTVINGLLELLQDSDFDVRSCAAESLGELGTSSDTVTNALLKLLQDDYSNVRSCAIKSLIQLCTSSNIVIATLLRVIQDDYWNVRYRVAESLGELGDSSNIAISALVELIQDDYWNVRCRAAESLGELGDSSNIAISALVELIQDDNWSVRSSAAESLVRISISSDRVVATLVELLQNGDSEVRYRVAESLGELGTSSDVVIAALLGLLRDDDLDVRSCAVESLGQLGISSDTITYSLLNLLKNKRFDSILMDDRAAQSLITLSKKSDTIKPALVQWIEQHQHEPYVGKGIDALWEMTGS
ncbi:HEAT repeat domain-containing protein [cf. Phormidesmis sp. LEGE 11477]|uniref:HEAT repeat domain-containing protein n=1 Tax=cf. Phormidesmis sp. LEGE 11477 TaxID=1828680 RepID=UPI00187E3916|nr:HEAT repeat domain-containing protein [cf. Phormidesmis sp. LEGE 11477]MBE9059812.1 HEAT repeat domain-containing protein [cf. Phormidesmis sp. LEGE 11477]